MEGMPDDFVDLTVTSPPYDNLRTYKGFDFDYESIIAELHRITKVGGVVVWIVADATIKGSETGTSFKHALQFVNVGFNLHDTMIYHKDNPVPVGGSTRYYQGFEFMFVFSKGKLNTFNPLTRQRRNKHNDKRTERFKVMTRNKEGELIKLPVKVNEVVKRNNVWRYTLNQNLEDKIAYEHPAIFPQQLATDHILSWSNPNDLVFDPMCGSGTTCKMAKVHGRDYVGVDISSDYCDIARKRLSP
jgi:site-specific DNA-methyltransferase (adenine-specific)